MWFSSMAQRYGASREHDCPNLERACIRCAKWGHSRSAVRAEHGALTAIGVVMSTVQYAVVNPATGETLKQFDATSDDDVRDAVGRAHRAHEDWQSSTLQERAEAIRRVGELHEQRKQELAEIIMREMGKPIAEAIG